MFSLCVCLSWFLCVWLGQTLCLAKLSLGAAAKPPRPKSKRQPGGKSMSFDMARSQSIDWEPDAVSPWRHCMQLCGRPQRYTTQEKVDDKVAAFWDQVNNFNNGIMVCICWSWCVKVLVAGDESMLQVVRRTTMLWKVVTSDCYAACCSQTYTFSS